MPASKVRVEHEQLDDITNRFASEAEAVERVAQSIRTRYEQLRNGGWVGQGAEMYFREMEGMVFPEIQRLQNALTNASRTTDRVLKIFLDAERDAAAVMLGFNSQGGGTAIPAPPGGGSGSGSGGASGSGSGSGGQGSGSGSGGAGSKPKLIDSFAAKFPQAAEAIKKSTEAQRLIAEAEAAGVEFGGFAEDGPGASLGRAYTVGNKVYVPRSATDNIVAAKKFLFELNNGIRAPKFAVLDAEAAKGSRGTLTATQYAYKTTELEVEGMLRLGKVWSEMKQALGGGRALNQYDSEYYLSEYQDVSSGRKTKDAVVRDVLARTYDTGTLRGKTVEQYYKEAYNRMSGGR
jgi:WXG100 family type VII secretion target